MSDSTVEVHPSTGIEVVVRVFEDGTVILMDLDTWHKHGTYITRKWVEDLGFKDRERIINTKATSGAVHIRMSIFDWANLSDTLIGDICVKAPKELLHV